MGPQIDLKGRLRGRYKGVSYQIMRHKRIMRHPENWFLRGGVISDLIDPEPSSRAQAKGQHRRRVDGEQNVLPLVTL